MEIRSGHDTYLVNVARINYVAVRGSKLSWHLEVHFGDGSVLKSHEFSSEDQAMTVARALVPDHRGGAGGTVRLTGST